MSGGGREPVTGATPLLRLSTRIRRTSLAVKLTALGALVTAGVVLVAFWALSVRTRASARQLFADELSRHQRTLVQLQRRNISQSISSAAVISQSPTLRSALETWRVESNFGGARPDLVTTVERELAKLLEQADSDVLLVTDDAGRVFAAAARTRPVPRAGDDLSGLAAVRQALDPSAVADTGNLAVYRDGDVTYQAAVYPLLLRGYTIGTLLLGQRIDERLMAYARATFDGEAVVTAGSGVLATTIADADPNIAQLLASSQASASQPPVIRLGDDELVVAPLALGRTQTGEQVQLWLMQPLGGTVRALTRPLLRDFMLYGTLAVLIAGLASGLAARSVLHPFRQFVSYMGSAASTEARESQFDARQVPAEVRALHESLERLMSTISMRTDELTTANAVLLDEIRERQRVERDLRERDEQLRQSQKLEAIGTLAGGIAHDFNNLITAVSGFTQLALLEVDPKSSMAADLRQVVEAADRAGHLTKQLLAFSRKQVLQTTVLDAGEVVRSLAPMLQRLIGEHITLKLALSDDLARVVADRGQLEQVIMNLCINARDAMPHGGVLTVTATNGAAARLVDASIPTEGRVLIAVTDTGTGIPETIRSRIFEPFFTTKDTGKGTGLGLSTVYGIVKQSGGTIHVDSRMGVGTTFTISLPAVTDSADPGGAAAILDIPRGSETVLLVEDDAAVRSFTRRTLEELGYTVVAAGDPLEALALAGSARVDVILSDIVLPRLSGPQMVQRFLASHPAPVVIFMTGYAEEMLIVEGRELGSEVLRKPFTSATLARALRDALDASRRAGTAAIL